MVSSLLARALLVRSPQSHWCQHNCSRLPPLCCNGKCSHALRFLSCSSSDVNFVSFFSSTHVVCLHRRGIQAAYWHHQCGSTAPDSRSVPHVEVGNQRRLCSAGLCAAAALRKVGIPYLVLEQRGELSAEGAAIGLWGNALTALDQIGAPPRL